VAFAPCGSGAFWPERLKIDTAALLNQPHEWPVSSAAREKGKASYKRERD